MQKKGGERLPGRPRSPFAAMSALGKSFLEALHASSEGFFRWRGFPRGAAKGLFFLVALPRDRGSFEGGRTSTVPRVVRPPLNALLVKAFSHKKPCAGVGARAPTNQFQDGSLIKPSWPGVRGLEAPGNQGCRGRPAYSLCRGCKRPARGPLVPAGWRPAKPLQDGIREKRLGGTRNGEQFKREMGTDQGVAFGIARRGAMLTLVGAYPSG